MFLNWKAHCTASLSQLVLTLSLLLYVDQGWYPDFLINIRKKINLNTYYSMQCKRHCFYQGAFSAGLC